MGIKSVWNLLKQSFKAWSDDYAPSMGAALSYYTLFSVAPLLLIVISVAGLFFGPEAVRGEVFGQLAGLMGEQGARAIQDMLAHVSEPKRGGAASVVGVVVLLLGASTVFGELQNAMDRIWRAPRNARPGGLWGMIRSRLLSFGMVLGIAFLLAVSLLLSAAVSALGKWWGPYFGGWEALAHGVDLLVSLGLLTVVFALIYKVMPRVDVRWHDVWVGAAVTAVLFTIGKFAIGLYLGKSDVATGFGAAGSLVIVMIWVYYSAQIFYLGAEFTRAYARAHGSLKEELRAAEAGAWQPRADAGVVAPAPAAAANEPVPEALPSSAGGISIRNGRLMVDARGRGLAAREARRMKRARAAAARPAFAPIALTLAAAAGLFVGVFQGKALRRTPARWLHI